MASEHSSRETSALVSLFQQAHGKIVQLRRLDDQIAALVAQHQQMQQEVREIQGRINEEFDRAIKFNQAASKVSAQLADDAEPQDDDNGDNPEISLRVRVPARRPVGAGALAGDDSDE